MTQNLRIGTSAITLTSTYSDVSSNFSIPATSIQTGCGHEWEDGNIRVCNNGNSWVAPTSSGNKATVNTSGTPPSQSQYIGNYYNWYTATAGTGGISSGMATASICPKNWKLPAVSDFSTLTTSLGVSDNAAGSWKMQTATNYFVLSGHIWGEIVNSGADSGWWSSQVASGLAYHLLMSPSGVVSNNTNFKRNGYNVRCVAR